MTVAFTSTGQRYGPTHPTRPPHALPVRQSSALPAASFGFHLAMDTLAIRLAVTLTRPAERTFTFQVCALCRAHQKKSPRNLPGAFCYLIRRRPTLPRRCQRSTIGAGGLNCRVRDGNGCDPSARVTGNPGLQFTVSAICCRLRTADFNLATIRLTTG
jgi:hypothetical protein